MADRDAPRVLDSLALAHYLSGDPAKAASLQRRAIAALVGGDPRLRTDLEARLAKYLAAAEEGGLIVEED